MYSMSMETNREFGVTILQSSGDCSVSDNCLPDQWQPDSIIKFSAIDVAFSFVTLWLAKQLLCKPFTTSAAVCLIYGATLNLTNLTEG